MTTTTKVLLLSGVTMAVWGIFGGSVAFVFGFRPDYALGSWLAGIAMGALQSAKMISEHKVNCRVFGGIHKTGDL